jgi:hypothetical protein
LVEVQCGEFCAICGKTPKELGVWSLAVDHDHETGLVRGLLCSKCNWCPHFEAFSAVEARYKYLLNPPAKDLMIPFPEDVKSKLALNEWRKKNLYDIVKGKYVKKIAEETMDNLK